MKIRRNLHLLIIFMAIVLLLVGCKQNADKNAINPEEDIWTGNYFTQENVITPAANDTIIRAKLDGEWKEFPIRTLPPKVMDWDIGKRKETIEDMKKMIMSRDRNAKGPRLAGPHNGIVASYGFKRDDSRFKLNNAVKGMGFLPKRDKIKEVISNLESTNHESIMKKMDVLVSMYENADSLFDLDKQVSLELYSVPTFNTQTFLNQITNPISTIVFLDIPSFKLKTIVRLLHPDDPGLNNYEKDVVKYINLVHSYFHGQFSKQFITVVYYIVEVYDDSPGEEDAMGRRIVPQFIY
ncbi:MAG: hypothetical protein U9P79_06725 [Candidatus Cloacimonadota bacterium]|nr:hypothetical protein [Candidatus Cloacimonadota bacterium]